jgi:hypothetical protein
MVLSSEQSISYDRIRAVKWVDGGIRLIDRRILSGKFDHL